MQHDEIYEYIWKEENEWLPFDENDVISTAFCYARYKISMEKVSNFGKKKCLTLPSLANKYFNSLKDENDEPIYTFTDPFMRIFIRNSIKGGRYAALNQSNKSSLSDEVFNIISKEIGVFGNIFEILDKYFEFSNKYEKLYAKDFDSEYDGFRDFIQKEKTDIFNNKFNMLPIHEQLSKLDLKNTQVDSDASSLYSSAMWDEKSVYPK